MVHVDYTGGRDRSAPVGKVELVWGASKLSSAALEGLSPADRTGPTRWDLRIDGRDLVVQVAS